MNTTQRRNVGSSYGPPSPADSPSRGECCVVPGSGIAASDGKRAERDPVVGSSYRSYASWRDPALIVLAAEPDRRGLVDRIRGLAPEWHARAACTGQPSCVFFPERGRSNAEALTLCARCDVRRQCLAEALADSSLDHGIRGGATAQARRAMRRTRQRQEAPT